MVLRNIASYNSNSIDIDHDDVRPQAVGEHGLDEEQSLIANAPPMSPLSPTSRRSPRRSSHSSRRKGRFAWFWAWWRQMCKLFSPKWRRTVILMWIIWGAMAFGEWT